MLHATISDIILVFGILVGMIACFAIGCYTYILSRRLDTTNDMVHCLERVASHQMQRQEADLEMAYQSTRGISMSP